MTRIDHLFNAVGILLILGLYAPLPPMARLLLVAWAINFIAKVSSYYGRKYLWK